MSNGMGLNMDDQNQEPMEVCDHEKTDQPCEADYEGCVKKLITYAPMLHSMINEEKNKNDKKRMNDILNFLTGMADQPTLKTLLQFNRDLDRWLKDKKPKPPEAQKVKLERKNGKLVATWTDPRWPMPLRFHGRCIESSGKRRIVETFKNVEGNSFVLSHVSPIQSYIVVVWAVDSNGQRGQESRSTRVMLCKKLSEVVYIDDTKELRIGKQVYKGYIKSASTELDEVAVKIVPVTSEDPSEVRALQKLKHTNIVAYRTSGMLDDGRSIGKLMYIVMELCETESFGEMIIRKKLDEIQKKNSLLHIVLGLQAIHEKKFHHRDLKPQNILRSIDGKNMKIADFGLSKERKYGKSRISKSSEEVGTDGWGSPEHYEKGAKMSDESDIYSGGLIFFFGLSGGRHVYGNKTHLWKPRIIERHPLDMSGLICADAEIASDLISKMLQGDPKKRPSVQTVLSHPFFWDDLKRLSFLHHINLLFAPFTHKKDPKNLQVAQGIIGEVIDNLGGQSAIITTTTSETNWLKRMMETRGVEKNYPFLLKKASGEVKPHIKYVHTSIFDLLRFIRNIEEHYRDNKELIQEFDDSKVNIWKFVNQCFPSLLCKIYNVILQVWPDIKEYDYFPKDAARFFVDIAHYEPLPLPRKRKPQNSLEEELSMRAKQLKL